MIGETADWNHGAPCRNRTGPSVTVGVRYGFCGRVGARVTNCLVRDAIASPGSRGRLQPSRSQSSVTTPLSGAGIRVGLIASRHSHEASLASHPYLEEEDVRQAPAHSA